MEQTSGADRVPTVLCIGGHDSGGGAGISADQKTFSALGVHGAAVITAVTAQNTIGVRQVFGLPPEQVIAQLDAVLDDFNVSWAKAGMLYSAENVSALACRLRSHELSLVIDPVKEAEAGGLLLCGSALTALKDELVPRAALITPNIFEAEMLTGLSVRNLDEAKRAGLALLEMGAKAAVITGGHLDGDVLVDLLVCEDGVQRICGPRMRGGNHGVGCTYSAALTVYLSLGHPILEAARKAQSFAAASVRYSRHAGRGVAPVDQCGDLRSNSERFSVLDNLNRAIDMLLDEPSFGLLIPEVGCNIGMAISGAAGADDVAAVQGRLVLAGSRIRQAGCPRFGASRHVARVILAALKHDARIRAAVNLRWSERTLEDAARLGLSMSCFDRRDEPPGAKSMSWGTDRAIRLAGAMPDIIWDLGGPGKEPMIRLLGEDAVAVAATALRLARAKADRKI